MTNPKLTEFYDALSLLVKKYQNDDLMIKLEDDLPSGIIKIFSEGSDSFSRAKNGISDASELAYTTAEHHPYWSLLYNSCGIAKLALEKWHDKLNSDEISEMSWMISELQHAVDKLEKES